MENTFLLLFRPALLLRITWGLEILRMLGGDKNVFLDQNSTNLRLNIARIHLLSGQQSAPPTLAKQTSISNMQGHSYQAVLLQSF